MTILDLEVYSWGCWVCHAVVECLQRKFTALGLIPSIAKPRKMETNHKN